MLYPEIHRESYIFLCCLFIGLKFEFISFRYTWNTYFPLELVLLLKINQRTFEFFHVLIACMFTKTIFDHFSEFRIVIYCVRYSLDLVSGIATKL